MKDRVNQMKILSSATEDTSTSIWNSFSKTGSPPSLFSSLVCKTHFQLPTSYSEGRKAVEESQSQAAQNSTPCLESVVGIWHQPRMTHGHRTAPFTFLFRTLYSCIRDIIRVLVTAVFCNCLHHDVCSFGGTGSL